VQRTGASFDFRPSTFDFQPSTFDSYLAIFHLQTIAKTHPNQRAVLAPNPLCLRALVVDLLFRTITPTNPVLSHS